MPRAERAIPSDDLLARIEGLERELAALRTATATASAPAATEPAAGRANRRGLLKRLGASAAVATVALAAVRPERAAADADVTVLGASTNQFGVYASRNSFARPAVPAGVDTGVLGIARPLANLTAIGATQASGVAGTADTSTGVVGAANDTGLGVGGICIAESPRTLASTSAGVAGVSTTRTAVSGISGSNRGVFGRSNAPAGTVIGNDGLNPGAGLLAAAVAGRSANTVALYGYSDGPPNAAAPPYGAIGQCEGGFGFWGFSNAPPGAIARPGGGAFTAVSGVLGTSPNNVGVYAISSGSYALVADGNGPATVGALIRGNGGAQAAVFVGNVQIQGNLHVTGTIGPTPPPAGATAPTAASTLRGMESREPLVEEVGEARLVAGRAEVRLDPAFTATLLDGRYHVVLTEYDDHSALYVTRRGPQGFEVRAKDSPTAASAFSYRVVGRRRDAEGPRAAAAVEPLHTPAIPAGQGVPTLPTVRDAPLPPRGSKRDEG